MSGPSRSLATVLFTDIVGSTERASEIGDSAWRTLLEEHHTRVRRELRHFGGRELNTAGDGFLALFQGPARAIACADAIRSAVRDVGLEVRCGVHMGEVEGMGKTVGGIGVHIAARVMAEASSGEVLVSRSVRDSVEGAGFQFEDRGSRALKGVPGEWRLFAVTGVPESTGQALPGRWSRVVRHRSLVGGALAGALLLGAAALYLSRREAAVALTSEEVLASGAAPGIAVLPFTVNDPALGSWKEGMVDLLSINLDGVPGLRPIASRTVMARWREEVEGIPDLAATLQVARRTGARYALVGNAVSFGPEVRFAAEIYDARTGEHLGSAGAQGSPDSVFALVDRLSIEIVRTLPQGEGGILPNLDLASVTTTSLPALKSYLEGESAFRRSDFEPAISAYRRAVAVDSTFALALMRLESANGWAGDLEFQNEERLQALLDRLPVRVALIARANTLLRADSIQTNRRGIDLLRDAAQTYPDDTDVWYYLGEAYTHYRPHVPGIGETDAVEAFSRVIALDESYTPAYFHLFYQAFADGDSAHAGRLLDAYRRFAPEDRRFELAFALAFGAGARDPQIRTAVLDTASTEDLFEAHFSLVHPRFQAAEIQLLQVLRERRPGLATQASLARQYVIYGRIEDALAMLDDPQGTTEMRHSVLYILHAWGLPIPADRLDRELVLGAPDTLLTWNMFPGVAHAFHAGAYAAERGRWDDHAIAIARLGEYERRLLALDDRRDHLRALHARQLAQALDGFGLWRQGRREDALRKFEAGRWLSPDGHRARYNSDLTISIWLGLLLLEMGRPSEAVPYFRDWMSYGGFAPASGPEPLASYYLGKAYAAMNESEKARDAYEFFAESWGEADPELQPMVQEARQASLRLQRE